MWTGKSDNLPTNRSFVAADVRRLKLLGLREIKSLLTSAATVQGLNAGRFAWGNSFHEPKEACSRSLSLGNTGTGAEPSDQDLPATPDQIRLDRFK